MTRTSSDPPRGAIASTAEAEALAARLARAELVALDTEGDGMFRYRTRLCTVQLATSAELAVVDTLATDARVFAALLSDDGPEKVVHDAAFDARVLAAHGIALGRVFDTAVAARFVGFTATGLATLLATLFDVQLPKQHQHADWGERPLDDELLAYLENDVRYLLPLRAALLERVHALDIEDELREECAHLLREARKVVPEASPFARVKGALMRPPKQRARLYELALARDELARERDVPPAKVVPTELLMRLAEREPATLDELARRLGSKLDCAESLFAALERAEQRDDAPAEATLEPTETPTSAEIALRKKRRELLVGFRTREAARRQLDPQVILPGHCVSDLVKLPRLDAELLAGISGLGACRIERYAASWRRDFASAWSA
ncbi:MAG: HRDC domain-containing protein [Polyangiales bacterium]